MYRDRESKNTYAIALTILIISNICFYTMEHLKLYLLLTMIGLIIEFYEIIRKINFRRIPIYSCIIWLGIIYTIFTINGIFRVRYGTYNWDMMLYTCVQNGAIFIALKEIVISPKYFQYIRNAILTSSIFSLFVLAFFEISNLGVGGVRIGDSLSGNVNVAGANFGILSIFMVYICEKQKKIFNWIILAFVVGVMLLTGSKMTLIILALDLVYFFINSKNKGVTLLLVIGAGIILLFLVFSVPVFYNVIGYRVEDMMYQLFGIGPGHASNSTNVRKIMLMEGFTFMWDHPIFGGGEKYFGSLTSTVYSYSHCNYTELLCNFGIVGFAVYYVPLFNNLYMLVKNQHIYKELLQLGTVLLVSRLLLDWMQVTHSEPCVGYIPMIFSFVCVEALIKNNSTNRRESRNNVENRYDKIFMEKQ